MRNRKRWIAILLSLSMAAGGAAGSAEAVNAAEAETDQMGQNLLGSAAPENANTPASEKVDDIPKGNLIRNPSFDNGVEEWTVNKAGSAYNNGHYGWGDNHFWTDPGGTISQQVEAPYTGYYKAGLWVAAAGKGGKFQLRSVTTGESLLDQELLLNSNYTWYENEIWLNQGEIVELCVVGCEWWLNGDDISLEYEYIKNRGVNIAANPEFADDSAWEKSGNAQISSGTAVLGAAEDRISQNLSIPQGGPYYAEVMLEGAENAEISFAGQTSGKVNGNQTVKVEAAELKEGESQSLVISGKASVKKAEVKFNSEEFTNTLPVASEVMVKGHCDEGFTLEASYKFSDANNLLEGPTRCQWLISDKEDGKYQAIEEEVSQSLVLKQEYADQYLKVRVIPVDLDGAEGTPAESSPVGPVEPELVKDPGFESGGKGWTGIGMSWQGAYEGGGCGIVGKGSNIVKKVTVRESAYYDLTGYIRYDGAEEVNIILRDEAGNTLAGALAEAAGEGVWRKAEANKILLEEGQEVEIVLTGASDKEYYVDNILLRRNLGASIPAFKNVKSVRTSPKAFDVVVDRINKTVQLHYLFGTDLSKVKVEEISVSSGGSVSVKQGDVLELSGGKEVSMTVAGSDGATENWKLTGVLKGKKVAMTSSNQNLEDTFNWAADKMSQFVMTDKTGPVNVSENDKNGTGDQPYIPSYWAGYYDRTAFYARDFVHQATGAQIAGLSEENYSMFEAFAKECNEARKWYTVWALNFDSTVYKLDYNNENSFVREVPAQFELVEKAYKQYLWSGDRRYIENEDLWNFYTNVMTKYVETHDENGNGVAQEVGTGIFAGSCTYNERGRQVIEAGDAIGSQYQATLAYAGMLEARGQETESKEWYQKAADLKRYFNDEWSVAEGAESSYVCAWGPKGERYSDFSKETSWFIPLKMISEPGERNDHYINFLLENLGDGIGTTGTAPNNIEAYTYIPDMLFLYNRNDDAWKWMKYITSIKDNPHERPTQGTNGDYPEISFTYVSHAIEGMMGVEPNAGENYVATSPRLPSEVPDMAVRNMQIGDYELDLAHNGNTDSTLTNRGAKDITWEARFYGDWDELNAGGQILKAEKKSINGVTVSYVTVNVPAGKSVTVNTDVKAAEEAKAKAEAAKVEELIRGIGTVTLESKAAIEGARKAYNALGVQAKAFVTNLSVLDAAEKKYAELLAASANPSKIAISKAKIGAIPSQTYNGKARTPGLNISYNGKKLVKNKDYKASYSKNKNIGTAKVVVTGMGAYTGSVTKSFQIIVKKNAVYTVGNYKYKITNSKTNGKGTVELTGVKSKAAGKKLKKASIVNAVAIGGKKFNVTGIGSGAFSGCANITSVTIGSNVGKIGGKAFYNCKKLKKITISSKILKSVGKNALKNIPSKAKIKVPKKKLRAYKKLFKSKGQKKTVVITA